MTRIGTVIDERGVVQTAGTSGCTVVGNLTVTGQVAAGESVNIATLAAAGQAAWYIDPVNGSDVADGTVTGPLKTLSEWSRRFLDQEINITLTVNILGNIPNTDRPLLRFLVGDDGFVLFKGQRTVLRTGTFTSVTDMNKSANQAATITDSSQGTSWTAAGLVAERIRITGGARENSVAYILKDLGTNEARVGCWISDPFTDGPPYSIYSFTNPDVQVGDPYVVESLTTIADLLLDIHVSTTWNFSGAERLFFEDITINAAWDRSPRWRISQGLHGTAFIGCKINGCMPQGGTFLRFIGCYLDDIAGGFGSYLDIRGGAITWQLAISATAQVTTHETPVCQSCDIFVEGYLDANAMGCFDPHVYTDTLIRVAPGGIVHDANNLWGHMDGGVGVKVEGGGLVVWTGYSSRPYISGSLGECNVGGVSRDWADGAYEHPLNKARIGDDDIVNPGTQTDWYINPVSGNDIRNGSVTYPLKTLAELAKRLKGFEINQTTVIHILSDIPDTDRPLFEFSIGDLGLVIFRGTPTTISSGTFTSVTDLDQTTDQPATVTDTAIATSWTADGAIEKRIRITSGAREDATGWVAYDLGTKEARIGNWMVDPYAVEGYNVFGLANVDVQVGDAYVVEELPEFPELRCDITVSSQYVGTGVTPTKLFFESLTFPTGQYRPSCFRVLGKEYCTAFVGCDTGNLSPGNASMAYFIACNLGAPYDFYSGKVVVRGGIVTDHINCYENVLWDVSLGTILQGGFELHVRGGTFRGELGFFDGDEVAACVIEAGGVVRSTYLWGGTGVTGYGVKVMSGGMVVYDNKPTVSGSTGEALVGGTVKAWSTIPYVETANMAMIVEQA